MVLVENGALDVSVDPTITIDFSKDVSTVKPDATTVTLTKVGGAAVDCDVTYDKATKRATLTTKVYLEPLTQYVLHIDNSISSGTTMGIDTDITFTTENVTRAAEITSAVWDATAKILTIQVNKPIKSGKTIVASDLISEADFDTPSISVSLDRKTIVVKPGANGVVLPGVNVLSFKTGGNAVPEAGAYKQDAANTAAQTTANSIAITAK